MTHSDRYHCGNNLICGYFGMYIEVNYAEGSTDGVMSIETVITPDEIES